MKKQVIWRLVGVGAVLFVVFVAIFFLFKADDEPIARAIPVKVHVVEDKQTHELVTVPGTTKSSERALLRFQISGRVTAKRVRLGDSVVAGAALASVYNPETEPLAQRAKQTMQQLQVQAEQAARDFQRIDKLYQEQAVTKREWEQAKTELSSAENAASAAQAESQRAQQLLKETDLIAPFDGVVTEILIEEGEVVQAGAPAIRLSNPDLVELELAVSDAVINNLKPGQQVTVTRSLALNSSPVLGEITDISPFRERGSLPQVVVTLAADSIKPGVAVSAELEIPRASGVGVPMQTILMTGEGNAGVYRVVDDIAQLVPVRPLRMGNSEVVIDSQLNPGDRIVTEGIAQLFSGARVEVMQ